MTASTPRTPAPLRNDLRETPPLIPRSIRRRVPPTLLLEGLFQLFGDRRPPRFVLGGEPGREQLVLDGHEGGAAAALGFEGDGDDRLVGRVLPRRAAPRERQAAGAGEDEE